jgi:sulfur relay (sulfurtransferase) DsrF/TusC family protein
VLDEYPSQIKSIYASARVLDEFPLQIKSLVASVRVLDEISFFEII